MHINQYLNVWSVDVWFFLFCFVLISKGENFFFFAHEALTLIKSTEEEMKHFGGDKKSGYISLPFMH